MNIILWSTLSAAAQAQLLERPSLKQSTTLEQEVTAIIQAVAQQGDQAIFDFTARYDGVRLTELTYTPAQIAAQASKTPPAVQRAIDIAYANIERFHQAQQPATIRVETAPGVICEQRYAPIPAVGLYVPGGSAVLPSTALMLGVLAQQANNPRRVLVSPPNAMGELEPALMYAAQRCEITEVYRCGGAQAIAALALGTESIRPVAKIFGPGNRYVTAAKRLVSLCPQGPAIDMPAGPSELLIIADESANAAYVAADLLSQAEHGPDSQVLLLSPSQRLIDAVCVQLQQQLTTLPRADIARQALANSRLIVTESLAQACSISQCYAPEHLSIQVIDPESLLPQLTLAGSIFIGHTTPEAGGDYATGTNHVLPTYGSVRSYSSLGLLDFYRRYTTQQMSPAGLQQLASTIMTLAETEQLTAHARALAIRLEDFQ